MSNAILPIKVRHDKQLGDKAKLLYAEINANLNAEGFCTKTNDFFAEAMGTTQRTVARSLSELISRAYVRSNSSNPRKLSFQDINQNVPKAKKPVVLSDVEDIVNHWESTLRLTISKPELSRKCIDFLLKSKSKTQIIEALESRLRFLYASEYHNRPENKNDAYSDILPVISTPAQIDQWIKLGK